MTASTEQERALANLRHLYEQMVQGAVKDSAQAKRIAEGLLSPAIALLEQAARRAPTVPVQQVLLEAAQRAHDWMDSQADSQSKGNFHSFDLLCLRQERDALAEALAAAPQPPEAACNPSMQPELATKAAPVQLPEPIGVLRVFEPHEGAQEVCTEATINAAHLQHGWYTLHAVRAHKNTQQEQHHGA